LKKKKSVALKDLLAEFFELPKDIMLDLPRLVLIGNLQLILENHRGIIEYSNEKVRIAVSNGEVIVKGSKLQIRGLFTDELSIEGYIETVKYED